MFMSISKLTRRFGQTEVLRGIDLEIEKGELIALLGPSGSGKTTLLKIIAGLDWPDQGALAVGQKNWLELRAQERRTGFVFQHYALFGHMSVRDNIAFGLTVLPKQQRPKQADIQAKVDGLLHFLQIAHLGDRYPSELSGGQRQRVALGRALAIDPEVLLLDEPFGALDAQVRRDLRRWLRSVHEATGSTTIFVTHDQEEAFELADRVVVMGAGQIEQIGRPDEIYDHPASAFVARFLGLTVEISVQVEDGRVVGSGLKTDAVTVKDGLRGAAILFARPADIIPILDETSPYSIAEITSTGAVLRLRLEGVDNTDTLIEIEVPRRTASGLHLGSKVALQIEAGQVFPL